MGRYLNNINPFEAYKDIAGTRFFVDKSSMIEKIISDVRMQVNFLPVFRLQRAGISMII